MDTVLIKCTILEETILMSTEPFFGKDTQEEMVSMTHDRIIKARDKLMAILNHPWTKDFVHREVYRTVNQGLRVFKEGYEPEQSDYMTVMYAVLTSFTDNQDLLDKLENPIFDAIHYLRHELKL